MKNAPAAGRGVVHRRIVRRAGYFAFAIFMSRSTVRQE